MEITTDIIVKGRAWTKILNDMAKIFTKKTYYDIFVLCASIGIMYDSQIEQLEGFDTEESKTVPKVVLSNNRDFIELLYQTAILTSTKVQMSEDERLKLAFDEEAKTDVKKKFDFLVKFANFGANKLVEILGISPLETMDNLRSYLMATVDGLNLDLDPLNEEEYFDGTDLI